MHRGLCHHQGRRPSGAHGAAAGNDREMEGGGQRGSGRKGGQGRRERADSLCQSLLLDGQEICTGGNAENRF